MSQELIRSIPDLPSRFRAVAYRAIVDVLMEDPVLVGVVKQWRTRTGDPRELSAVGDGECPIIALSPIPFQNQTESVDHQRVNFGVSVQLFVQGSCVDDLLALWEAVEDAILADKPFRGTTVQGYLCHIFKTPTGEGRGILRLRPDNPAFNDLDVTRPTKNVNIQQAKGSLTSFFRRPDRLYQSIQ